MVLGSHKIDQRMLKHLLSRYIGVDRISLQVIGWDRVEIEKDKIDQYWVTRFRWFT
jgi:hypothetical protein